MTDPIYPSTKALSVYNALSLSGRDMTPAEVLAYLRDHWDPKVTPEYVAEGAAYLIERKMAHEIEGVLIAPRLPNSRKTKPVKRANDDRDLVWV